MPLTASINRHPETENQSETAAEEMKGTLDLAIGNAVSVKATFRASCCRRMCVSAWGEFSNPSNADG